MSNKTVTYAQLPSIGGYYFVGSDGSVFRIREVHSATTRGGYKTVQLFDQDGKKYYSTVHALVAGCFIGPRPTGLVINHKDGQKTNNDVDNLEYCTNAENIQHAWANGLCKRNTAVLRKNAEARIGKKATNRKFSDEQAIEMIALYRSGEYSMKYLGKRYRCSASSVHRVVHGTKVYQYIPR